MGFRFRKSIKIAPGIRINVGKRGMSLSAGPRGASVNIGSRGVYGNVGIPGTGMSYRTRLDSGGARRALAPASPPALPSTGEAQIALADDGSVRVTDASGNELPPKYMRLLREQHAGTIEKWLEAQCDHWNKGMDEILNLHLETPAPSSRHFTPIPFDEPRPVAPSPKPIPWYGKILRSVRERIEQENAVALAEHGRAVAAWQERAQEHEAREVAARHRWERAQSGELEAMGVLLEEVLSEIEWPRETNVSFEFRDHGHILYLDVDLPEIEDLPTQTASVVSRGWKIKVKDKSETQQRKDYLAHVHAVLFRVIGTAFAYLPALESVVASGFSQRADPATGQVKDDYLLSARANRREWEEVDFSNLEAVDLVACLERFDLRRKMTKTGIFTPVEPHTA